MQVLEAREEQLKLEKDSVKYAVELMANFCQF